MSIRDFMAPGLRPTFKSNVTGQVVRPTLVYEPLGDDHGTDIVIKIDDEERPAVIVDRARFERLREYVESERVLQQLLEDDPKGMNYLNVLAARDRFHAARDALQDSDFDPLP